MKASVYRRVLKRPIDVAAAVALGVLTLPVSIGAAVAIKLTSPGPILFRQKRLSRDEREFDIIKFRSMYVNAPSLPPYKLANPESHITPVGKWLRKFSVDEIPQVINVIRGDMSFVGPRPGAAQNEEDLRQARREFGVFKVRPGITGWAQVNGRDELAADPRQKAEYDAFYVRNISLLMDIKIVLMTVATVLNGKGYSEGQTLRTKDDARTKVLFLIHTLGGGGAERVLTDLVGELDPTVFDITVMTVVDTGVYRERLPAYVRYKYMFPVPSFIGSVSQNDSGTLNAEASSTTRLVARLYAAAWRLIPARIVHRIFIRETYDTEVAFLEGITTKVIAGSPNPSSRKLGWVHTDFETNHKSQQFFLCERQELRTYRKLDEVIFVSAQSRSSFYRIVGAPDRERVLHNPINVDQVRRLAAYGPTTNSMFRVCVVGRLTPVKGIDRLLEVKAKLEADGVDLELLIVGDGPEMGALKAQATGLHNVVFAGYQSNPYPYIASADLFLIPSRVEGFSTVMIEALILGVPVMSTRVSGSDVLTNELVIDNETMAIATALREVIEDSSRYEQVRQHSSEVAKRVEMENCQHRATLAGLLGPTVTPHQPEPNK